jgi:hypothetical protein
MRLLFLVFSDYDIVATQRAEYLGVLGPFGSRVPLTGMAIGFLERSKKMRLVRGDFLRYLG